MRNHILAVFMAILVASACIVSADGSLEEGFRNPPKETEPWCYWYWIGDHISREGITRDLEAMKRVGIGTALIGNIYRDNMERGPVPVLSEKWWELTEHAIREANRLGLEIGLFNSPGWSQSGGPWVKPEQAMRYIVVSEKRLEGPGTFEGTLPAPADQFQDVAVIAFRAPKGEQDTLSARSPEVSSSPKADNLAKLVDGDFESACSFPAQGARQKPFVVDFSLDEPFTARSLTLHPKLGGFRVNCTLQAAEEYGTFRNIRTFTFDRRNPKLNVGPMPHSPVTVAFDAVRASRYRLVFTGLAGGAQGFAEIELSGAARLEEYISKQLGKMHPTPSPTWSSYLWRQQPEPNASDLTVPRGQVQDISDSMSADGALEWQVPEGEWIVQRLGMTPTGVENGPAAPNATGLEVDKTNPEHVTAHFDAFVGKLLDRLSESEEEAFKYVVADSYETGSQNWTDGFAKMFRERYGYDPMPWLPVFTGRIVGSADLSDRFLWDVRRLIADRIARGYVGCLSDLSRKNGLQVWLENYGHWGFPAEFLQYGGQSDLISGEFWVGGNLGQIECRAASSAADTYARDRAYAEAFTSGEFFRYHPYALKARGDWSYCQGINHFVLHVYIQQPYEDMRPGINQWFGTEFNRHNTWFEQSRAWIDYLQRCHYMLQKGRHAADVCYFIGEDAPKMTGTRQPPLPNGYDYDYINAEVIEKDLKVENGRFVIPGGPSYRLMVLPPQETMRPELLEKIRDLVEAGGAVLGPPPTRSPSMENYPACDRRVRKLAGELWGECDGESVTSTAYGRGRVFHGVDVKTALDALEVPADVGGINPGETLWTHRSTDEMDIYFVSNQKDEPVSLSPVFRVKGKAPELLLPVSGETLKTARYRATEHGTRVPLNLDPAGSVFVVFRKSADETTAVEEVERDGQAVRDVTVSRQNGDLRAEVRAAGDYRLQLNSGQAREFEVPDLAAPSQIDGPWEVRFPPNMDVPEKISFPQLKSWPEHSNEAISYFSGTATYRKTFEVSPGLLKSGRRLYLDLGRVEVLAEVILNGKNLGILWKPPFEVDITEAARTGKNRLEVRVTNLWRNRILGDLKYPEGYPGQEGPKEFNAEVSVLRGHRPNQPLDPSGLLGPVMLRSAAVIEID